MKKKLDKRLIVTATAMQYKWVKGIPQHKKLEYLDVNLFENLLVKTYLPKEKWNEWLDNDKEFDELLTYIIDNQVDEPHLFNDYVRNALPKNMFLTLMGEFVRVNKNENLKTQTELSELVGLTQSQYSTNRKKLLKRGYLDDSFR